MASDVAQSYQQRQEEELQALQSIYSEVEDLRTKSAWNVWQPVKMKVKLNPQESQGPCREVFAQVEMIITCSARYPDDVPTIELQNPKNVPEKKLSELREELMEMARACIGEVMIMNLAEMVREFLHKYNNPPAKSFHDQMMEKQRRMEEERAQRLREQQERKRCEKEEEMRQVEELMRRRRQEITEERNENRFKKGITPPLGEEGVAGSPPIAASVWTPGVSPIIPASAQDTAAETSVFATPHHPAPTAVPRKRLTSTPRRFSESEADEVEGRPKGNSTGTLVFNKGQEERHIQRGKQQTSQGGGGSTVYWGVDQNTGEPVAITEWVYRWRKVAKKSHVRTADLDDDKEGVAYLKQVMVIEQETAKLIRLSHPNIVRYLGFRHQREPGKITVHVLSEYCGGSNLDLNLHEHRPVPLETLRHHTEGMLQALHYLHEHTVVHRLFRASCVFVDSEGQIQLSDYDIDKRLRELYKEIESSTNRVKFEDSTDRMPPTLGRGSKKGDIYQLGVTVLALSIGDYITDTVPEIPKTLHPALIDFLSKCLVRDDRQRWSTSQLLGHQFLKEPLTASPSPGRHGANRQGGDGDKSDSDDETTFVEFRTKMERDGTSRLTQEFHVEKTLGKGGFGDVLKVKNKLDGQVYAIKRVMINTRSKELSRKITREVNLLSQLNHENIVRYYNAWMESTDELACSETSSGSALSSKPTPSPSSLSPKAAHPRAAKQRKNSLDMFDNVELMAPKVAESSVDWSFGRSLDATAHKSDEEEWSDDEDDDEDDDDGHWGMGGIGACFMLLYESDDSVDFGERSGTASIEDQQTAESESQTGTPPKTESDNGAVLWCHQAPSEDETPRLRCLYIQMQYCEKSTLRRAIDQGLYKNMDRVWKYFREITEGLLYIHKQKMIHRDLKPVNIFLDANDLVKIGDFGLATTDIYKKKTGLADSTMAATTFSDPYSSRSGVGSGDGDMTGEVGTALYVSPEIMKTKGGSKLRYDQKVDIYSLGIIFFEMVYKHLGTSMERLIVLSNLRKEEILFPDDFNADGSLHNQAALLRQMLNHDPSHRPSSKELLQSPHLPAVQEAEVQFYQRVEEAARNPEGPVFRRILTQFFARPSSMAMDMTYNMDQGKSKTARLDGADQSKGKTTHNPPVKTILLQELAKERMEKVFQCHGAVRFSTPLLMPRPKQYDPIEQLLPCLLDKSGAVVNLPFDLRLPFARYVAHNATQNFKRYSIECVYRQPKAQNLHPREFIECAFDIVTTAKNCVPDAQLLIVVQQIIDQFPVLQKRDYMVKMNHTKLLEAVLLNAGVPDDKLTLVMQTLVSHQTITEETIRTTLTHHHISLSAAAESQLKTYLETEADLQNVSRKLLPLTRQHTRAGSAAKEGLHDLGSIQQAASDLGLKMKMIVSLCLVYNLRLHSGLIFQVYYKKQHKKQKTTTRDGHVHEVIASGGRYDKLLSEFSHNPVEQRAVGVSIAFDIILSALIHETELARPSACDVMVCTLGQKALQAERLRITRNLLAAGIRTELEYEKQEDIEDLQEKCRASGIPFLVVLKETKEREGDSICIRLKMLDSKTSGLEKRVSMTELADVIQQKLAATRIEREAQEVGSSNSSSGSTLSGGGGSGGGGGGGSGSNNRSSEQEKVAKPHSGPSFNFTYTSKMSGQTRKRIEQSVCNKAPKWLTGVTEVVVTELPEQAIRTIQAHIELSKEDTDFNSSVIDINEKLARHRRNLTSIMDHIRKICFEQKQQHLLLYGTKEDTLRLLT